MYPKHVDCAGQGCQVWPFRGQKMTNFAYFVLIGLEIFFMKYLAFLKVYRSLYSKIKTFSFFKTEFGIFKLQAPGNSECMSHRTLLDFRK